MYSRQQLTNTQNFTLKLTKFTCFILVLFTLSMKLFANDINTLPELTIKPNQCVSLNQGQKCYIDIDLDWRVNTAGEYCLYASHQSSTLKCWESVSKGNFQQSLVIDEDITFTLRSKDDDKVIVTTVLELAWVHKKARLSHSSWRVF